jgi:hypothetical protein
VSSIPRALGPGKALFPCRKQGHNKEGPAWKNGHFVYMNVQYIMWSLLLLKLNKILLALNVSPPEILKKQPIFDFSNLTEFGNIPIQSNVIRVACMYIPAFPN